MRHRTIFSFFILLCSIPFSLISGEFVDICRDAGAGGYEGFPDICRLRNGHLMCAFYAGCGHLSIPKEQLREMSPEALKKHGGLTPQKALELAEKWPLGGRLVYCISKNEGRAWSKPKLLYDGPKDERDPSLTQLKGGRLLCTFFCAFEANTYLIYSDDQGKTWSHPKCIASGYYTSSPVRELSSGTLILGLYRQEEGLAKGASTSSHDGGNSWSQPVEIDPAGNWLDAETDIIELANGTLYACQRNENNKPMMFATSRDSGHSWSPSKSLGFPGHAPYLFGLKNNIVLLGYRNTVAGNTSLRYSTDNCKSWSKAVQIDRFGGAYPSFVTLKDNSVLAVYYTGNDIRGRRFWVDARGVRFLSLSDKEDKDVLLKAWQPRPRNGFKFAAKTTTLEWFSGNNKQTCQLFLGSEPGTLERVSQPTPSNKFTLRNLEDSKVYYWRVDTVSPDGDTTIGDVWQFSVGKHTDDIGAGNWDDISQGGIMSVSASGQACPTLPTNTVNGSGLEKSIYGKSDPRSQWFVRLSSTAPDTPWLEYDFGQSYTLKAFSIWNSITAPTNSVEVQYKTDNSAWIKLGLFRLHAETDNEKSSFALNNIVARKVRISLSAQKGNIKPGKYIGINEITFQPALEK